MATAKVEEDLSLSLCPICFERFVEPRKLSVCSHSFCEGCILTYITELKTKQELGDEFQCPVCRQTNPSLTNDQDMYSWVKSLELNHDLISNLKSENGFKGVDLCVRCKDFKKPTFAVKYCLDCREYLCENCCRIGHGFKVLKDHTIVDINQGNNDSEQMGVTEMMSQYLVCPTHPEKICTYLCKDDDNFCCTECILVKYKHCYDIVEIKEQASKETHGLDAKNLVDRFAKLQNICEAIVQAKKENEAINKKDTENIVTKIQEMRTKVNHLFDLLEETVVQQCKALTKKNSLAATEEIEKLQKMIKSFDVSQNVLQKALKHASPSLQFIILKSLRKSLTSHETRVLELHHTCRQFGFELNVTDVLGSVLKLELNTIEEMAKVVEKENDVVLPDYSERQLLRCYEIEYIDKHIIVQGTERRPLYSGMVALPDNQIVLADYANCMCCLVNAQYQLIDTFHFDTNLDNISAIDRKPVDATCLKSGIAAVSVPTVKKIYFFSTSDKLEVVGDIRTRFMPYALHGLRNGDIIVSWAKPTAFGILKFSHGYKYEEAAYFDRDKNGRVLKSFVYIAVDEDRSHVIQPCRIDKALYCFDFDGHPMFTYKNIELSSPCGVSIDEDGNIYVCDTDNSCIHQVSPDGSLLRIIKKGCPENPIRLIHKENSAELVVTNGFESYPSLHVLRMKPQI